MSSTLPRCVEAEAPLSALTTFGVGGKADYLAQPADLSELLGLLGWCRDGGRTYRLLGRGSNVLLPDEGIAEVVVRLGEGFSYAEPAAGGYLAGAAYSLPKLAIEASRAGKAGLERFVGIPATFGGAVTMNAGCLGAELESVVGRVRLVTPDGEEGWVPARDMDFRYRWSRLQQNRGLGAEICVEVELALGEDAPERLMEVLRTENKRRHATQPYTVPSAGSVFKNPPGNFAGRLIEQTGLKGLRVGGAEVSPVHANFIVNPGGATARDIVRLMAEVHNRVRDAHGLALEPEIQLWGGLRAEFDRLTAP